MQSTATKPPPSQLRFALCGLPGTRKTTFILHLALFEALRGKKLYIADLDGNMRTALRLFEKHYPSGKPFKFDGKEYKYEILYTDFNEATQKLNKDLNKSTKNFTHEKTLELLQKEFDVVAKDSSIGAVGIDSQTVLNTYIIDSLTDGGSRQMYLNDWGSFEGTLTRFIFAVRSLNRVTAWSAHEVPEYHETRDAKGNVTGRELSEFVFNIPGKSKNQFASFFSDVISFDLEAKGEKVKWTATCEKTALQLHVKNSLNLPNNLTLPNEYTEIFPFLYQYIGDAYPRD